MTHTKGPWRAINLNWGMQILPPQGYGKISVIAALGDDEKAGPHRTKEVKANAQLIAAAPDLLEACEAAAKLIAQCQKAIEANDLSLFPNEAQRLRVENDCWEALAKAKGEVA